MSGFKVCTGLGVLGCGSFIILNYSRLIWIISDSESSQLKVSANLVVSHIAVGSPVRHALCDGRPVDVDQGQVLVVVGGQVTENLKI